MSVYLVRVEGPDDGGGGGGGAQDRWLGDPSNPGVQVTLPVVLGRGSLLKCGEKRVSRRHAYLDWEDKGVLLTAVHQSPTYVVVGNGALQEVMEGSSVLLSHGDKFGFLKDRFWYKVSLPNSLISEEKKLVPSSGKREEVEEEKQEEEEEEEEEKKEKEEVKERKEEEEKANETPREAKGEFTENRKWAERSHEAVNGDTSQEATTTRSSDTTDGGKLDIREEESKVLKADHGPQQQEGAEDAEGGTEKQNGSSPSSSTPCTTRLSDAPSPKRVIKEKVLSAVSKRERNLPQWLQHTSGGSPATPTPPAPATPRSRQRRPKAPTTSSKTQDNPTIPASPQADGELFSLDTVNKRQRKKSPQKPQNATTKAQKLPQQHQNQSSSSAKERGAGGRGGGGGGGKVHHQMSDDSDGEDIAAPTTTTTTTTSTTTTTAASTPSSPHTSARHTSPAPGQISKSETQEEEEEEEEGVGGSTDPPRDVSPAAASPTPPITGRRPPRPSCQYGAKCYRKNRLHRKSEAHPGDPDYHSPDDGDSDGDGDGRPECEYGVDCYRRNPQHRRDFKHSRIPQPQRRAKRKARQQKGRQATGGAKGSDDDEYDLDDSFLYDGSSDDYAPTDNSSDSAFEPSQDGEEEEDAKRMLKEAKKFVKKRK